MVFTWTAGLPFPFSSPTSYSHPAASTTHIQISTYVGIHSRKELQLIRKVFRPLHFFHILLRYSLILKWIKCFFHTIPHNAEAKTGFQKCLQMYSKLEIPYLHKHSDTLLWDSNLSSGASCFHWSSLRCFYNLFGVSTTRFGKAHACL